MPDERKTLLERLVQTSVRLNGVIVPAASLERALGRHVENLCVWNDHETFKVSLVGSAVPVVFRGRYFLLCSNHQLRGRRLEQVCLLGRDGQHIITSSGVRHFWNEARPDYLDLAAFEFTEPCQALPELQERFFDFRNIPPDAPSGDVAFALVAGYPSKDQQYELEDKNHIGKVKRIIVCEFVSGSYDPALLCLRTKGPLGFDPDGMSGGSAFVVQYVRGEFQAFFAGMVVTAGIDHFHIIKVGPIEQFLRMLVRIPSENTDGEAQA